MRAHCDTNVFFITSHDTLLSETFSTLQLEWECDYILYLHMVIHGCLVLTDNKKKLQLFSEAACRISINSMVVIGLFVYLGAIHVKNGQYFALNMYSFFFSFLVKTRISHISIPT